MKKSWIYIVIVIIVVLILIVVLNKSGTEGELGESTVPSTPQMISLTELQPLEGSFQGFGVLQINKSVDENKLKVNGVEYEKGLGTHTVSEYKYAINGNYSYFEADIGLDEEIPSGNFAVFVVKGDGVELYRSDLMKSEEAAISIKLAISGVQELSLITEDGGDGISGDHTDWLNPVLVP